MTVYAYFRTGKYPLTYKLGMNGATFRSRLIRDHDIQEANVYEDSIESQDDGIPPQEQWREVDSRLARGDILVVPTLDHIGLGYLDLMGKVPDLVSRGVRLRSLRDTELWVRGLDADPESPEWAKAEQVAILCSFSARGHREQIAQRRREEEMEIGAEGTGRSTAPRVGRRRPTRTRSGRRGPHSVMDDDLMIAILQELAADFSVADIGRKYLVPPGTLRNWVKKMREIGIK